MGIKFKPINNHFALLEESTALPVAVYFYESPIQL
jgi:hypothetical protein